MCGVISRLILLVLGLALSLNTNADFEQSLYYKKALAAINQGDVVSFEAYAANLKNYILYPYIEYHRIRVRLDAIKKSEIDAFFNKYPNQPIANHLKNKWVNKLIQDGKFSLAATYTAPEYMIVLRCNILTARIKSGFDVQYLPNKDLWLYGKSRPDACDPVFEYWQKKAYIGVNAYSQRAEIAIAAGQMDFAQKLALKSTKAIKNLLAANLIKKTAIIKAKSFENGSYARLNALPVAVVNDKVREWKARQFIHNGDWLRLRREIKRMPESQRSQDVWVYWLARSEAKLGNRAKARELYKKAANNSSFYGFLSSDRLGINYSICPKTVKVSNDYMYSKYPELRRAFELRMLGSDYFASREWNHAIKRMPKDDIIKASIMAAHQGWYIKSILELGKIREFQYYEARFPLLFKNSILNYAKARGLDPAFAYGIARTESALRPDAISPVGARGLMQLMPATALQVAKKYDVPAPDEDRLLQPDYNVALGTGYLEQMAERWNKQLILMMTSYNAGPHRSKRWINILPHEADRFIATIPFDETRKYVSRVLDYTVMYSWRLGGKVKRIGGIISNIGSAKAFIGSRNAATGVVCRM